MNTTPTAQTTHFKQAVCISSVLMAGLLEQTGISQCRFLSLTQQHDRVTCSAVP